MGTQAVRDKAIERCGGKFLKLEVREVERPGQTHLIVGKMWTAHTSDRMVCIRYFTWDYNSWQLEDVLCYEKDLLGVALGITQEGN